ncbi:MAG: FecR domain-containing protein [Rhodocyclales bacterium]|nr:FecR domain-containing protein [Rhodocyclales bacterium]
MNRPCVLLLLLALAGSAWCGEPVGRVILAAGEVAAARDGQWLPLARNADVRAGDEIRTGPASSVQIRFADASIVALRSATTFRVDEFIYKRGQAGGEKALFALIKGGLRTITGAVGRTNHQDYGIVTPTSTIGIRGTHFSLAVCADDCRNADGSLAANGTYGGVIDGRIASTPNEDPAGAREFGRGEFFFAPNASAPPQPLLTPPSFLADRLEAQRRATAAAVAAAPGAAIALSATTTPASTSSTLLADTAATTTTALPAVATETLTSSGTPAVINMVTGFIAQFFTGSNYIAVDSCSGTMCQPNQANQFTNSGILLTGYASDTGLTKGSLAGGTVVDTGSVILNGAVFAWGRWTGSFLVTDGSGTTYSSLPSGVLYGMTDDVAVGDNQGNLWPTSGVVSYAFAGGPSPVDTAGNTGTVNSMSGSLDFLTRNVSFNASLTMNVPTQGVANLSLSSGGTISATNDNLIGATLSTTCSGAGCASPSSGGSFDARFAGTAAQVMVVNGIGQNAILDSSGTGTQSVLFLGVLKCTSGC